jgi:hypothetical protein
MNKLVPLQVTVADGDLHISAGDYELSYADVQELANQLKQIYGIAGVRRLNDNVVVATPTWGNAEGLATTIRNTLQLRETVKAHLYTARQTSDSDISTHALGIVPLHPLSPEKLERLMRRLGAALTGPDFDPHDEVHVGVLRCTTKSFVLQVTAPTSFRRRTWKVVCHRAGIEIIDTKIFQTTRTTTGIQNLLEHLEGISPV